MKYWRLYNSAEKEVGFVPQIVEAVFEGYYTDSSQLWNIYRNKMDKNTIIPKGHLHKKAKLTDLMSVSFCSGELFLSDKLRIIMEGFKAVGIQFAATEIIIKTGERLKSNIIHPFESEYSFIDAKNSTFHYTNSMGDGLLREIKIVSGNEYLLAQIKNRVIVAKIETMNYEPLIISKIEFDNNCGIDLFSVFGVMNGGIGIYVSERLKDKILEEKCTGVIFREINERYP